MRGKIDAPAGVGSAALSVDGSKEPAFGIWLQDAEHNAVPSSRNAARNVLCVAFLINDE